MNAILATNTWDILNNVAYETTIRELEKHGNILNEESKSAIKDIIHLLTSMANGIAEQKYYVSSLDPGMGKTTAIIQWLNQFCKLPDYDNVGVLVCFDRHDQIKDFVKKANLKKESYGICVSKNYDPFGLMDKDPKRNINKRQVLITTKKQISLRSLSHSGFKEISGFFYLGRPRKVLIWDETLIMGKGLVLSRAEIGLLIDAVTRKRTKELGEQVYQTLKNLYELENGQRVRLPNINMSFREYISLYDQEPPKIQEKAEIFWNLAGKEVLLRGSHKGLAVLGSTTDMPCDFKPYLVTDASARVRHTYRLHQQSQNDLVFLKQATKQYTNLTCYLWDRGSGKTCLTNRSTRDRTAEEIYQVIKNRPNEKFLLVYHKPRNNEKSIYEIVCSLLKEEDAKRVFSCHYGIHTSTNDFSEIPNVILAGINYYSDIDYEALGRATANTPIGDNVDEDDIRHLKYGEIQHHILQAACRGAIRKCINGKCPKTNLWVIGSHNTGVTGKMIQQLFPEAKIEKWEVVELTEKQEKATSFIDNALSEGENSISLKTVREYFGVRDNWTFTRDFINDRFIEELEKKVIKFEKGYGKKARFIRI